MADRDYEVGYGKPPREHQFPKGTSGFTGRKHKPKASLTQLLDRILREKVTVAEGGKKQRLSKEEVFLRQLVARAIGGDRQLSKLLLDFMGRRQEEHDPAHDDATEEYLIKELKALVANSPGGSDDQA